jgi:hypothetical protein
LDAIQSESIDIQEVGLSMRRYISIKALLLLSIFIVGFLSILMPIGDPDFFWHIATGRWIFQNKTLPSEDPFSFTTPKVLELRDQAILKGYWLSQVLYYVIYLIGGWNGIIFLRILVVFLLIFFLIKRREAELNIHLLVVFLSMFVVLNHYFLDRPQVFSFLFFAVLLYLIDTIRKARASTIHYISMPLLMTLWANMHGAYILGQFVIFIYLVSENIKPEPLRSKELRLFSFISIISIATSFINPLLYKTLPATFQFMKTSYFTENIIEYSSTIIGFFKLNLYILLFYWLIAFLTLSALLYRIIHKDIDLADIVITGILLYFSFTQIRYVAFFIIWSVPLVSNFLNSLLKEGSLKRFITGFSTLSILFLELYTSGRLVKNLSSFYDGNWISLQYPAEMARFIKAEGLKGNMYNFYDWGGYLIWELGPERKVFIDGRGLHSRIFATWLVLAQAVDEPRIEGIPYWRAILDTYRINLVLLPIAQRTGIPDPLVTKLLYERDWIPVFLLGNSVLFVKDVPENRPVIYRYSIPKETIIDDMIANIDWQIQRGDSFNLYISKGDLYLLKNDLSSAEQAFRKVLEHAPFNTIAKERLRLIKSIKDSKKEVH